MREWLDALAARTKAFAADAIRLGRELEDDRVVPRSVSWQFVACATSVGANHRASRQSRSERELVAKLGIVLEEADESVFWLELIGETALRCPAAQRGLLQEARELRAIFSRSRSTMLRRTGRSRRGTPDPPEPDVG